MLFVNQYQNFKNSFVLSRLINYGRKEHTRINPEGAPQKAITDFQVYDKGCACFLEGEKYPMRAHIVDTKVSACCNMKRLIPLITRFILGKGEFSKSNWFQRFVRALEIKDTYPLFKEFVHFTLMDEFLELNRYSQPVRELYRVIPEKWSKERDIACFFLEYDMAYRYRFQDVLVELDKEAFKNNPAKEIGRLFDILSSREGDNEGDYSLTARWGALKNLGILTF